MGKIIRISFLCLFLLLALTGCTKKSVKMEKLTPSEKNIKIFLSNREKNSLVPEEANIISVKNEDIVTEIFGLLQTGIEGSNTVSTVPTEVRLLDLKIEQSKVVLNFSEEYNKLDTVDENICRMSLIASLTELSFIDAVEIYVEEVPLKGTDGKAIGPTEKDQLVLDDSESDQPTQKKVLLYFGNDEGTGLVSEEVEIEVNPNEPLEKTVLSQLMKGPQYDSEVRTIPEETKIISTSISEGVCYVDLSREFITKHRGGSASEQLTVYSIVNTLTELPDINKVQFLIEGEKEEQFGELEFDILFPRNLDLVIEKK